MEGDKLTKRHDIAFGDLVYVDGYGNTPFYIDGWQTTTYYEPDAEWTDTLYDLTCAHTGEYEVAYDEDIKRICSKDQAEDYLELNSKGSEEMVDAYGWGGEYRPNKKTTARNPELEKQREEERIKTQIDKLLDDYIDAKTLEEVLPEDAEKYREQAEDVIGRLAKFTE